jgi:hypothetical protein
MFIVTREMYHSEMATAVYEHMREFLLGMDRNHCQRVEFLPIEVMRLACQELWEDQKLRGKEVEAFVLSEKAQSEHEIESGALIEKRNRAKFGVLVVFIPQGLRLPAEDSYDIQTFKTYDLSGVLRTYVRKMIDALPDGQRDVVSQILNQRSVMRQPIDRHLKYLLAVKNEGGSWHEAGAYLFHLNL